MNSIDRYISEEVGRIPNSELKAIISQLLVDASRRMAVEPKPSPIVVRDYVINDLQAQWKHLKLMFVCQAFQRGSMGELEGYQKLSSRTVYGWIKETVSSIKVEHQEDDFMHPKEKLMWLWKNRDKVPSIKDLYDKYTITEKGGVIRK